jgi:hypothetical protein
MIVAAGLTALPDIPKLFLTYFLPGPQAVASIGGGRPRKTMRGATARASHVERGEGANEVCLLLGLFKNLRILDRQPHRNTTADSLFSPI